MRYFLRNRLRLGTCKIVVCLLAFCLPLRLAAQTKSQPPAGLWDGTIQGKAGEVDFGIDLQQQGSTIRATLMNATDRLAV